MNITNKGINKVKLVGKVISNDFTEGLTREKQLPYITSNISIQVGEGENAQTFIAEAFEMRNWKVGTPEERENPKYNYIKELAPGERISIAGAFAENRFPGNQGEMASKQYIRPNFFNTPYKTDEDGMTFEVVGILLSPVQAIQNAEEEITHYTVKLGVPNYKTETGLSMFDLHIDAKNTAIAEGIRDNFQVKDTISVKGTGYSVIETVKQVTESMFGADDVQIYHNEVTRRFIEGVYPFAETLEFSNEEVDYLVKATADNDEVIMENEKAKKASKPSTNTGGNQGNVLSDLGINLG